MCYLIKTGKNVTIKQHQGKELFQSNALLDTAVLLISEVWIIKFQGGEI